MKKLLTILKPLPIAILSLLVVSIFLRYYLYLNSAQLVREFKNQNYREIYSLDSMKISSRLNSLSSVINWVCIEAKTADNIFYKIKRGNCQTSIFQQNQKIYLPHANNLEINFTSRLPKEVEWLFLTFLIFQSILIFALILSTKKSEEEKRSNEIKLNKLARQMSHDIRSPLATLNTILDEISSILPRDTLRLLQNSLVRINEISGKHLENSQSGLLFSNIPKLEKSDIVKRLSQIIELKKIEFKNVNIFLKHQNCLNNNISQIDIVEFERIISNIINNSIEAQSTTINVLIENGTANNVDIKIKDNGLGIPLSVLEELGRKEITTKRTGNGLGIIHAKESVESWKGSLNIRSKINEYTEVTISLPIETIIENISNEIVNILLDDDELVRVTWEFRAKKLQINLKTYAKYDDLKKIIDNYSKKTNIFLDSELGENIKGEDIAKELHSLGFENIYITSGNPKSYFNHLSFIKEIRDKTPPW